METVQVRGCSCSACGEQGHNRRSCQVSGAPVKVVGANGRNMANYREWRRLNYQANLDRKREQAPAPSPERKAMRNERARKLYALSSVVRERRAESGRRRYAALNPDAGKLRETLNAPGAKEERARNLRDRKKAWRAANPDRVAECTARWVAENRDKVADIHRKYLAANPEKKAQYNRNRDRDKVRAKNLLRDHRSATAPGRSSPAQIRARAEYWGNVCSYCGGPYEHMDHSISLARGGTNWPANLRPSCADCNLRKCAKSAADFIRKIGRVVAPMPLP